MSGSVSVNQAKSSDFTWDTAEFAWKDGDAGKSWAEAGTFAYQLNAEETVGVSELTARNLTKSITESWSIAEKRTFAFALGIVQAISLTETFTDVANFTIRFTEALRVGDQLGNSFFRTFNEQVNVSETSSRNAGLGISESLAVAQVVSKKMTKVVAEALTVLEKCGLSVRKAVNEQFQLSELRSLAVRKEVAEAIAFLEVAGRTVIFKRNYAETLNVQESLAKAIKLSKSEAVQVLEEYRRHANAVISDMSILQDELDLFSFANVVDSGHAPGFADFKDFIPGDYTYDKAIFRVILESTNTDRARLRTLNVSVDVPDVTDRGTATITISADGIRINFNRSFHIAPEVTLTLRGGEVVAIPTLVGQVDASGFTAVLINPKDNTRVAGTFTWSAAGY